MDIYLNGASLTCSYSAPIYVESADTCTIHLVDGSTNYVSDSSANEKSAAIFSKDDLTIKGGGEMTVVGNAKHAIKSNNDVKVKNGTLDLYAVSAGIYGEDSIQVTGGNIIVYTCKDGLKACDSTEIDGYVTVEDGYIDVQNASGNGIQADVSITISGGSVNVHSTKKGLNCDNAQYVEGCYYEY
ncbi:MAG: carbohydrate-binding domain-containing protein [Ruminococcus sp.]|nr:carbohydrate-binding domain-containing protein [Ruminococcus sp.]